MTYSITLLHKRFGIRPLFVNSKNSLPESEVD